MELCMMPRRRTALAHEKGNKKWWVLTFPHLPYGASLFRGALHSAMQAPRLQE